jgi:NAD(P)H-nitrite reductase large subunit
MDHSILICRCREVTREEILEAIADGATTINGVKRRVRSGMGLCQGKTCGPLVAGILAEETGRNPADILPQTSRMPVRPVKISVIGGLEDD